MRRRNSIEEILAFENAVKNAGNRTKYLSSIVREDVRGHYRAAFKQHDQGNAKLVFVTNCSANENQRVSVGSADVEVFHLDDLLQFMADHIEDAMPRTNDLVLNGISTLISTTPEVSEVPTSIVFAQLADFISYMDDDPFDLLFARNVRLTLGNTPVNREIAQTFVSAPTEFAYSNNGITVLCEKVTHDPGKGRLTVVNPRVVNGSQTLHSIRNARTTSAGARADALDRSATGQCRDAPGDRA